VLGWCARHERDICCLGEPLKLNRIRNNVEGLLE
jgi:hypothetical protein